MEPHPRSTHEVRKELEPMTSVPDLRTDVLLHSEQTGGHVSVCEIVVPPHNPGPPLHTHDFDEAFYLLEGELIFQVDQALTTKRAGELSFAPRNVPHALANHSDLPARYLLVCTPAGFERHWARMAAEHAGVEPPQWALQPIPEVTVVGPQIAAPT
jgi:quercetin dioxygenase-like cupin family protein